MREYAESQGFNYHEQRWNRVSSKINVISQTTAEREQETVDLFNKVKPLLDEGCGLSKAVRQVTDVRTSHFQSRRWYKDLKNYAKAQGY